MVRWSSLEWICIGVQCIFGSRAHNQSLVRIIALLHMKASKWYIHGNDTSILHSNFVGCRDKRAHSLVCHFQGSPYTFDYEMQPFIEKMKIDLKLWSFFSFFFLLWLQCRPSFSDKPNLKSYGMASHAECWTPFQSLARSQSQWERFIGNFGFAKLEMYLNRD